ncbi:hypothetical protein PSAB6_50279 [Paraburkholderia sabiae]|nr:hypothetical protein PSAB6_50279 [Paraburkholderia sabiae]
MVGRHGLVLARTPRRNDGHHEIADRLDSAIGRRSPANARQDTCVDAGQRRLAVVQRGQPDARARPLDAHADHPEPVVGGQGVHGVRRSRSYETLGLLRSRRGRDGRAGEIHAADPRYRSVPGRPLQRTKGKRGGTDEAREPGQHLIPCRRPVTIQGQPRTPRYRSCPSHNSSIRSALSSLRPIASAELRQVRSTQIDPQGTVAALQTGQSARAMSDNMRIKLEEFSRQAGSGYKAAVSTNAVLSLLRAAGTKPSSQIERNGRPGRESSIQGSSLKPSSDGTAE